MDKDPADKDPAKLPTMPPSGSPLPEPVPLRSDYVKERLIGQGAMGQVWQGRRGSDGSLVAIKVLRQEYASDRAAVARFVREGMVLTSIDHAHVVPVHDIVAGGGMLAIVMELVSGENLRDALARGVLDRDRSVTLLGHVAQALAAIHAAGVVHRDVKPENVLVTWRDGAPWGRLTDFGVAHVADGQHITAHATFVGTHAYLAPEVALGRPPTSAVDVYALGVMAYELLAGRRPFTQEASGALLQAHINDPPAQPAEIGGDLWRVVAACLDKEPARRPSASDLVLLLGGTGGLPPGAPPPLPPPPASPSSPAAPQAVPPAPPAGASSPAGASGTLTTSGPTTVLPEAPAAPPPRRRRRWPVVAGLAAVMLASTAAGLWYGLPPSEPIATTATPRPTPTSRLYSIPVTVKSPARGRIRIMFDDVSSVPGFQGYRLTSTRRSVWLRAGQAPPYVERDLDPGTWHCYTVEVLVLNDKPVPPPAKPVCRMADGRDSTKP
ncbi:serine/threonine-protein kinase [Nonomuraea sp. NPDC050783]|uniref:serine/threonine-protein kinase n=1 Tax=Nonomuraea sp. NPDC050783 TaxID=3154634 RepID=UPI0034676404